MENESEGDEGEGENRREMKEIGEREMKKSREVKGEDEIRVRFNKILPPARTTVSRPTGGSLIQAGGSMISVSVIRVC